jgi:hypothetical protein
MTDYEDLSEALGYVAPEPLTDLTLEPETT